jgi:hypothetical protein
MASAVYRARNGQLPAPARALRRGTHLPRPREVTGPRLVESHSRTPQVASRDHGLRLSFLIQRGVHVSLHDLERVVSCLAVPLHEDVPAVSSSQCIPEEREGEVDTHDDSNDASRCHC